MRRTILFVHPSDELYGSDRCLLDIIRGLPAGDRAIVVLPTDLAYAGSLSRALEATGARVEHVDMLVLRRAILSPARLPELLQRFLSGTLAIGRIIRRHDVTLVHSNTVAVVCGAGAAALTRTPHLWHVHEHIADEPPHFRLLIRIMLAVFPGLVVANSRAVARALIGGSGRLLARTRVVENGVNPGIAPLDRTTGESGARPVVGVVGRLAPRKGVAEALRAAAVLVNRGIDIEMKFVGGPPPGQEWRRDDYLGKSVALGIEKHVTFAGEVEDVSGELFTCDVLLLPSQRPEPFGLVVLEGMAAGLPVIATLNGGGSDHILEHGVTGVYCGRDPLSIAGALEPLVRDQQLRQRIGSQAVRAVQRRYTIERYRSAFGRLYDRLASRAS